MLESNLFEEPKEITVEQFLQLEKGDVVFYNGELAFVKSAIEIPFPTGIRKKFKSMHHCIFEVYLEDYNGNHFFPNYPLGAHNLYKIKI